MHFTCQKFRRPEHSRNAVRKFPLLLCLWFSQPTPGRFVRFSKGHSLSNSAAFAGTYRYNGQRVPPTSPPPQTGLWTNDREWPICLNHEPMESNRLPPAFFAAAEVGQRYPGQARSDGPRTDPRHRLRRRKDHGGSGSIRAERIRCRT